MASPGAALVLGLGLVAGAVPVVVRTAGAPAQVEEVEPSAPFGERGDAVSVQGPPAPAGAADAAVEEARRLLQAGDAEGSLAVLQRVVSVRESPEAHKVLARALRRLGRFEEADGQTGDYRRGRLPDGP